jgi:cytochrome c oxidase assembly protein subunit 11
MCEALGILASERQVPGTAVPANTQVDTSRTITVEFDANARGPWDFKPEAFAAGASGRAGHGDVRVPERAEPPHGGPGHSQLCAAPGRAALQQAGVLLLQPVHAGAGEKKEWPVAFVIDPKLPKDVKTITLSYTFFEVGGKTPPAPVASVVTGKEQS